MDRQDDFDRIVASLHECSLNPGCWDRTAALLAESLGLAHHHVAVVSGSAGYLFGRMDFDGRPRPEIERNFAAGEFALDERTPRIVALPHARVVSGNDLWSASEKRRSYIYNRYFRNTPEFPDRTIDQLLLRLDVGSENVGWCLGRTDDTGEWTSEQIALIERLVPHVVQFVHMRQSLAKVRAWGAAFEQLLLQPWHGLALLDRYGAVMSRNEQARRILSQSDELGERDGFLFARSPADNDGLEKLLGQALPHPGREPAAGAIVLGRTADRPPLTVSASPVTIDQGDYGARRVAVLVRITDPTVRTRIDPGAVEELLGLTPAQSYVAALLAQGQTVRDIAAATDRKESSVRFLLKQTYLRLGVSRQVDLVRMVLMAASR